VCAEDDGAAGLTRVLFSRNLQSTTIGYGSDLEAGTVGVYLAFTRYCQYRYCMVYGTRKGCRGGVVYCAIDAQKCCNCVGNAGVRRVG